MTDEEKQQYELRLKRRLEILKKEMDAGNVKFSRDLTVVESLKAVRYGSDGEIDLTTVDSGVRALALAVEQMHHRRETKTIASLLDLQRGYFEFFERNFSKLYKDMKRDDATPFQVGSVISRDPEGVRIFHKAIPEVLAWVEGLWKEAHDVAHIHAEDIAAALDQAMDVPKIKDVPKRVRTLREESKELRNSAVGMLFQVSESKKH